MIRASGWFGAGVAVGAAAMIGVLLTSEGDDFSSRAEEGSSRSSDAVEIVAMADTSPLPALARRAETDINAALAELRAITDPFAVRVAALALLDVLDNSAGAIERIAAMLPESDRLTFRIDALAQAARHDPSSALKSALAVNDSAARRRAVERIAAEWVRRDAPGAFDALETIPDRSLRAAFRASALAAWAALDPTEALAYVIAANRSDIFTTAADHDALRRLAAGAPTELLAAVDELPLAMRRTARDMAVRALGERDPQAAIAIAGFMPAGPERDSLLSAAASNLARHAPDTTLEWARALQPPSRSVALAVLQTIAQTDFDRALEIALETPLMSGYSTVAALPVGEHLEHLPAFASELAAAGETHASSMRILLGKWVRADAEGAVDWAVQNRAAASIDEAAFRSLALDLSREDAAAAGALVDRIPEDLRAAWVAAIATYYGYQDPLAASRTVMTLSRGATRDEALGGLARALLGNSHAIDSSLWDAFSSGDARDDAIRELLPYIRSGNAREAARLAEQIGDPNLLAELEEQLGFVTNKRSN